ncbi:MAG: nucleotidyltransferase domain-containing protein [Anaerolineae bacterium]|jgi:hypothetical protein
MSAGGPLARPISEYLPRLKSALAARGVILAYLYGSQVAGTAGPLSDVDLAVLFRPDLNPGERARNQMALHHELAAIFDRPDVFVADLAMGTPLFKDEVRRGGQIIYCRDEADRVEFQVRTLQEFVDTEPLRRIRNAYLLERIEQGALGRYMPKKEVASGKS